MDHLNVRYSHTKPCRSSQIFGSSPRYRSSSIHRALTAEITKISDGLPLEYDVANAVAGQMAYDFLSPTGQLLLVERDLIPNEVEGKNIQRLEVGCSIV